MRGQFRGYRSEPGVNPTSRVETYVAYAALDQLVAMEGRAVLYPRREVMATTSTEVVVRLRQAPAVFTPEPPPANCFRFQVTPTQTIAITSFVKLPGDTLRGESVNLKISEHVDPHEVGAYEELLTDALRGVSTRFARQDYVEDVMAHRGSDPGRCDAGVPVRARKLGAAPRRIASRPDGGWVDILAERAGPCVGACDNVEVQ